MRSATRLALSGPAQTLVRRLARAARSQLLAATWRVDEGPWFDNQLASLELTGRRATLRLQRAVRPGALETVLERELSFPADESS